MPTQAATLAQAFQQQAQKYGDRVYLKDKRDKVWRDHSWREIADAAARLRAGFIRLGVRRPGVTQRTPAMSGLGRVKGGKYVPPPLPLGRWT